MERITTDVLVIGAGPAGSSAALAACRNNTDVLLVERKKTVGVPVQCAEFIPAGLLGDLGLDRSFCVQKIRGMRTFIRGALESETKAPGFMINRDRLDQMLAEKAVENGTTLLTSTKAVGLGNDRTVVLKRSDNRFLEVSAKVIIAADGPLSVFRTWLKIPPLNLLAGIQLTFELPKKSEFTQVYLDPDIHAGYGWVFPKVDKAHVGLGFKRGDGCKQRAWTLLKNFSSHLLATGKIAGEPLSHRAGWIPAGPIETSVHGNTIFAGDAAGQTHPITGAGIFSAISCGKMAGKWASKTVLKGKLSLLSKYDHEWQELFGRSLTLAFSRRAMMESEWRRFDDIIKSCWVGFREYHA